jgi:hypothetical protein
MRKFAGLVIGTFAALLLVWPAAFADDKGGVFKVDPRHAGIGAFAGWARDAGEPGQKGDPDQYGLHLMHLFPTTPDGPFAGTDNLLRKPISAASLTKLGFSISGRSGEGGVFVPGNPKHGYCSGGSPRFVIESSSGTCHLGCAHADSFTQDPNTNWWDVSFVKPFAPAAGGCPAEPSGTITYMDITVDEGPDTSVTLDNITATIGGKTTTVGKPDDGKGRGHDDDDD